MQTFNMRQNRRGSDDPEAVRNRMKHANAADSRENARKQRMAELKTKIKLSGSHYQREALKVAELGYGWRAVQLASWGHLTDNEAKDLAGEHR